MLNDNVHGKSASIMREQALAIVPAINILLDHAHNVGWPAFFAADSFLEQDFIFKGRMKPHAIRGTRGAMPIPELHFRERDHYLPKRRFSAFFKTDLDQTLRTMNIDTVVVTGIATNFCVLATAFDAVCNDFNTVILEDCCAAAKPEWHEAALSCYRKNALEPLFRIMKSADFFSHEK
ncbi:MAG: cysteine hydrolase [Deltaproteobacteria bacterium]|nr:cysteine hydrolase [Deltaproteobacteria bacterium]